MTDTLESLRAEWQRMEAIGAAADDPRFVTVAAVGRGGHFPVLRPFVQRLLAALEAAEQERKLDLVALGAAEKDVDALKAHVAALRAALEKLLYDDETTPWQEAHERARRVLEETCTGLTVS